MLNETIEANVNYYKVNVYNYKLKKCTFAGNIKLKCIS